MELKSLMIDTKSVWMPFPGTEGFEVEIANLSRKEMTAMRKNCTIQKFDRKLRTVVEAIDEDKFVSLFTEKTVKNWKGLTYRILSSLILIKTEGLDMDEELEYSQENAEQLITGSVEFDNWLNEVVYDLDNFRN